jgi:hypothetical protein
MKIKRWLAKVHDIIQLDGDSIRDSVDARDRYELLRRAQADAKHSYGGSMKFEPRGDAEYLIRRPYASSTRKSFGRRSPETEAKLEAFLAGKARVEEQITSLRGQLEDRAPILRARGLGRVPLLTARVIRKLDDLGWLGTSLIVLGTNALFAYEAKAAVRIESGMLATGDVDVLFDARRRLVMSGDTNQRGLIGALQAVDRSFNKARGRTYTAANRDGYMVDLIEPQDHGRIMKRGQARLSDDPDDLVATTTDSSKWLLNAPKFEAIAFDERGLPVRIVTLDPRVFALQKQWIVENDPTRDPAKRIRDEQQAKLVAMIAIRHLGLKFDDTALSGLPKSFRDLSDRWDGVADGGAAEW